MQYTELLRRQCGVVSLEQLAAQGIGPDEVRRRVRRNEWRRVRSGVVAVTAPSGALGELAQQAWAALLVLPRGSVACGPTAAALLRYERGVRQPADELVHVLLPPGARHDSLRGCRLREGVAGEVVLVAGVPCTSPVRTCLDEAARLPLTEAVVLLDSAARADPELLGRLWITLPQMPRRGRLRADAAVRLATGLAESALESLAWVLWHEAGLPAPVMQATIKDRGRFVARVDFLWPAARVVVEVGGLGKYAERGELQREKERQNRLVRLGYMVLRFTWVDVVGRPAYVLQTVRTALGVAA